MEPLIVITGIVSLIALICFFIMGSNIAEIKIFIKKERRADARVEYHKHLAAGNTKEAYEALLYIFYYDLDLNNFDFKRKKEYDNLRKTFEPLFKQVGHEYPPYLG